MVDVYIVCLATVIYNLTSIFMLYMHEGSSVKIFCFFLLSKAFTNACHFVIEVHQYFYCWLDHA